MTHCVRTIPLPQDSALQARIAPGDFVDCYAVRSDLSAREAAERIVAFPGWVKALMRLRGVLVTPFGLLQDGPGDGPKMGPFPVEHDGPNEVIAGFNDKHLNFRVAIRSQDGEVSLATWVRRNNLLGRAYLALIMPFHILVARAAVARARRTS